MGTMLELKATVPQSKVTSLQKDIAKLGPRGVTLSVRPRSGIAPGLTELMLAFQTELTVVVLKRLVVIALGILAKHDVLVDYDSRMETIRGIVTKEMGNEAKCIQREDHKKSFTYKFQVRNETVTCTMDDKQTFRMKKSK